MDNDVYRRIAIKRVSRWWETSCCRHIGERFTDKNDAKKESLMMERVSWCEQELHTENSIAFHQWWQLERQRYMYRNESLAPNAVPFVRLHNVTFKHNNARLHEPRLWILFLASQNVQVLDWPAYLPDTSSIEQVWDALDRRVWGCVPVPSNVHHLWI
jgi:hypothetical protein